MKNKLIDNKMAKYLCVLTMLFVGTSNLKAQELITIQQAIDNALKNNLQVKQAEFSEGLSELNLQQSKMALLPNLGGNVNQNLGWGRNQLASGLYQNTKNYTMSFGLSTSVELFGGLTKINQIKQNKSLLEAGKSNLEKVKNDLVLSVITAYLQVLYNKDLIKAAKAQLKVAEEQAAQQQKLMDAGNKTLADVSQAKSQVSTASLSLTDAENALEIAYINLAQLMEIPSSSVFEVQAPAGTSFNQSSTLLKAEEVYQTALKHFPDIKSAEANTQAAQWSLKIAKGNLYPRLSFNASWGTSYFHSQNPFITNNSFEQQLKDNVSKGIGLGLSIPIFNGSQASIGVKRAQINLSQAQSQEALAKNNLGKIVYQAVADARAANGKYNASVKAFEAQKDAFYAIEQRYQVGLANAVEYNTALTNRNKAETDMIQARYDLLFKSKVIDYYLNKPIVF